LDREKGDGPPGTFLKKKKVHWHKTNRGGGLTDNGLGEVKNGLNSYARKERGKKNGTCSIGEKKRMVKGKVFSRQGEWKKGGGGESPKKSDHHT